MAKRKARSIAKKGKKVDALSVVRGVIRERLDKEVGPEFEQADVGYVPYPSIGMNWALGGEGAPLGRLTEIYGAESSGKSTLGYHLLASVQEQGGIGALIETEGAFDRKYARKLDVDVDDLLIRQPDTIEEVFKTIRIITDIWKSQALEEPLVVVWDSVAATPPKAELEGEFDDKLMAEAARAISKSMRMITKNIKNKPVALVFINQTRERIGVTFGSKVTTYGGKAIKFHATHRISLRTLEKRKDKAGNIMGISVEAKVDKNKLAPPFRKATLNIEFGIGIDTVREVFELATDETIIQQKGSWYNYGNNRLGQGKEAVIAAMREDEDLLADVRDEVITEFLGVTDVEAEDVDDEE